MLKHNVFSGYICAFVFCLFFVRESDAKELLDITPYLEQGGLVRGSVPPGYQVKYAGQSLQITPDGTFIIGLGRDAPNLLVLTLISPVDLKTDYSFSVKSREYKVQSVTGVPQRTVNPSDSDTLRIRQDSRLVKEARRGGSGSLDFLSGFIKPLEGPITGVYGSQRVYNGVPKSPHYGVDYAAMTGTLVFAPASGEITLAHPDLFYSGGTIIMDHGFGLTSSFLHLSEILVSVGQRVEQGDPIAKVGSTGRATGPHLDWRMNWLNVRIDPQLVMDTLPGTQ